MADTFRDVFKLPDLKRRILFTLGMLFVFRLGAQIPVPGIDKAAMEQLFTGNGVLGFLDMFAGGALRRFSIFSLGVAPYINASIVMQLAAVIFPALQRMQKEGPQGQKKMTQYTRYGAIFFAFVQAFGMTMWLSRAGVLAAPLLPSHEAGSVRRITAPGRRARLGIPSRRRQPQRLPQGRRAGRLDPAPRSHRRARNGAQHPSCPGRGSLEVSLGMKPLETVRGLVARRPPK